MPRSRYVVQDADRPHFVTCTVHGWLPVFTQPEAAQVIIDCWRFLQGNREFILFGYVIMVNHLHFVGASPDLTKTVREFKSFTARKILNILRADGAYPFIEQLTDGSARCKLWRTGSHPEQVRDTKMLRQKLTYMHGNPVKRGYVDDPLHWRHSSARNYAGLEGLIEVMTDWQL